jgi:hypothetical protein
MSNRGDFFIIEVDLRAFVWLFSPQEHLGLLIRLGELLRMTALENMTLKAAVLPYPRRASLFERFVERSAILRKVLITDDRLASRKGLRALMLTQPDIQVIGEATNGEKAIQFIKSTWKGIRVVILTLHNDIREEALAAGADAFLVKGCSPDELISEIRNERRKTK